MKLTNAILKPFRVLTTVLFLLGSCTMSSYNVVWRKREEILKGKSPLTYICAWSFSRGQVERKLTRRAWHFSAYFQSIITEEPLALLRGSALGSPGSVPHGSSSWSHLTETNPAAVLLPKPRYINQMHLFLHHIKKNPPHTSTFGIIIVAHPTRLKRCLVVLLWCRPYCYCWIIQSGELSPSYPTSPARHIKIPEENKIEKCSQLQNVLISC